MVHRGPLLAMSSLFQESFTRTLIPFMRVLFYANCLFKALLYNSVTLEIKISHMNSEGDTNSQTVEVGVVWRTLAHSFHRTQQNKGLSGSELARTDGLS